MSVELQLKNLSVEQEANRLMNLCNACRYCEGFCPVFPAMATRRQFDGATLDYLANLCHNCSACYHACQYKPPHEFAVNVPATFAELRLDGYQRFAWPGTLASALKHNGLIVAVVTALTLTVVIGLATWLTAPGELTQSHQGPGAFYTIISHRVMVAVAGSTFLFALLALTIGAFRFWRTSGLKAKTLFNLRNWLSAGKAAATLEHLGGGHGEGCNTDSEKFSNHRRWFHHFTAWGFMLCFAATCSATIYEYALNRISPFPFFSLPVLLGTSGGIGLIIGCTGLWWVKRRSDPIPMLYSGLGMDYGFIALLLMISVTGMALLILRSTAAMPGMLIIHLGFVLAFFLLLPYSKFVHGVYRFLALLRYAEESRQ